MPSLLPNTNPQQGSIATAQITIIDQNDGISADVSIANFTVLTSIAGIPFSNSFDNLNGRFFLRSGNIDITHMNGVILGHSSSGMTVEFNVIDNVPVPNQPKGYFRVVALNNDDGVAELWANYRGENYYKKIYAAKLKTETGGSGTTSTTFATTTNFYNLNWDGNYQPATDILTIDVGGSGVVELAVEAHHSVGQGVLRGQLQYNRSLYPGWINVGSAVLAQAIGGSAFVAPSSYRLMIGPFTSSAMITPGEPQSVQFRLLVRRDSGTGTPTWLTTQTKTFAAYWRAI
jgi:hypothetical protein